MLRRHSKLTMLKTSVCALRTVNFVERFRWIKRGVILLFFMGSLFVVGLLLTTEKT